MQMNLLLIFMLKRKNHQMMQMMYLKPLFEGSPGRGRGDIMHQMMQMFLLIILTGKSTG